MRTVIQFLRSHPVLIVAYPVDLGIGVAFMLSIAVDADDVVKAAFCGFVFLIVTVKLSLAAERTIIGNTLCAVAVLLNAFAATSFFVTHAAPHAVVRETPQIGALRDKVAEWDRLLTQDRAEIERALSENRRTAIVQVLRPQQEADTLARQQAQDRLDTAINDELSHNPDAIEVFERPFRLLQDPSLGRVALLLFGLGASLFLEGVMWRSMRRRPQLAVVEQMEPQLDPPIAQPTVVYPRTPGGQPKPPAIAAIDLGVSLVEALKMYEREKKV